MSGQLTPSARAELMHRVLLRHTYRPGKSSPLDRQAQRAMNGEPVGNALRLQLQEEFVSPLDFVRTTDNQEVRPPQRLLFVKGEIPEDFSDPDEVFERGESLYMLSRFQEAHPWMRRATELYPSEDVIRSARARTKLASSLLFVNPGLQDEEALGLLNGVVTSLDRNKHRIRLADALNARADALLLAGYYAAAEEDYDQAFRLAQSEHAVIAGNARYGLARVIQSQMSGHQRLVRGETDANIRAALECYSSALSLIGRANCGLLDGVVATAARDHGRASAELSTALHIFAQADNALGVAICHEILGDVYASRRFRDVAICHRTQAWDFYSRSDPVAAAEPCRARINFERTLLRIGYKRRFLRAC